MSKRKRKQETGSQGSPQWMTTFSDLMTLLLTFFILLFSFSSIDAQKFEDLADALQSILTGQGGITIFESDSASGDAPIEEIAPTPDQGAETINNETKEIYGIVQDFLEEEGLEAEVTLRTDRRGVIIDIKETILFDSGKAELKPESHRVLDKLTRLISQFNNEIIVEGHTDDVPIHRYPFPSNWELSVTRATTVVRYFTEEREIDPTRLSVAGYGEYEPIAPNDNTKNRALNRRVNILIVTTQQGGSKDGNKQ